MSPHRRFAIAFALLGAATLTLQAVFLREMLAVFWGSERVVGSVLGNWLLLGGIGSALLGPAIARRLRLAAAWPAACLALALLGPATVALLRALPVLAGADPGRLLPFWTGAAASLGALAPAGLLAGALFALGTRAWLETAGGAAGEGWTAARAYLWDTVGSMAGGLALTAALVAGLPSDLPAALAAGLCAAGAAAVTAPTGAPGRRVAVVSAAVGFVLLAALVPPVGRALDTATLALAYPGEEILARRETPSGQVVVTRRHGQTAVYCAGRFAGSPDVFLRAEEVAHLALLQHARPDRVLVAGGVLAGWVPPALQHRPGEVELLETDEAMSDLLEDRLGWRPGDRGGYVSDTGGTGMPPLRERVGSGTPRYTRLHLSFGDPRMRLRASPGAYDAILLPGGAPDTFAQHRLMSVECFREARAALAPGGVLAFPVPGFRSFQNRPHRRVLASLRASLRAAFPHVRATALESGFLFTASDAPLPGAEELKRRWADRGLRTREMVAEGLGVTYLGPADDALARALDAEERVRPDLDFEPVLVGYQQALADATAEGRESAWGRLLADPGAVRGWPAMLVALAVGLAIAFLPAGRRGSGGAPAIRAAFLAGLAGLALEVLWLDGFQIVRGNLYHEAGALLSLFMAGSCAGVVLQLRAGPRPGSLPGAAAGLLGLALLAVGAGSVLGLGSGAGAWILPAANFATGALVGWTFASAVASARPDRAGSTGAVYGADLFGAAVGGFLASGLLVPLLGLPGTGAALALACAPTALRLLWAGLRGGTAGSRSVGAAGTAVALAVGAAAGVRGLDPGAGGSVAPAPLSPRTVAMEGREVMGSWANLALVVPAGSDLGSRGAAAAFEAMGRVDALLSDYRVDSEAARIRALPEGGALVLDPWTAGAIEVAALVHRATGGAYDPTIRPAHRLYCFTGKEESPPAADDLARAMARVGLARHGFDPATRRFTAGPGGADLDFGGVGKGDANDRAAAAVGALGIRDALLTLGGEVLALGTRLDGNPWRIGIRDPRDRGRLAVEIDARPGEAFSTSGGYEKFFLLGGVRQPHVLDARTGRPAAGATESVTVIYRPPDGAPPPRDRAGAVADALATGLFILGPDGAREALREFPGADALFLVGAPDGAIRAIATPGARARARFVPGVACEELKVAGDR